MKYFHSKEHEKNGKLYIKEMGFWVSCLKSSQRNLLLSSDGNNDRSPFKFGAFSVGRDSIGQAAQYIY